MQLILARPTDYIKLSNYYTFLDGMGFLPCKIIYVIYIKSHIKQIR